MESVDPVLQHYVQDTFDVEVLPDLPFAALRQKLIERVDELFRCDMEKLKWILYRIDVQEAELTRLLRENTDREVAEIIADAIIQRQLQKIETRKRFSADGPGWEADL
jgi:hypothetical protein